MNLHTALTTSWNNLKNMEHGISLTAKNIANANDENYARLELNTTYNKSGGT